MLWSVGLCSKKSEGCQCSIYILCSSHWNNSFQPVFLFSVNMKLGLKICLSGFGAAIICALISALLNSRRKRPHQISLGMQEAIKERGLFPRRLSAWAWIYYFLSAGIWFPVYQLRIYINIVKNPCAFNKATRNYTIWWIILGKAETWNKRTMQVLVKMPSFSSEIWKLFRTAKVRKEDVKVHTVECLANGLSLSRKAFPHMVFVFLLWCWEVAGDHLVLW